MSNSQYEHPLPSDMVQVWLSVFERQRAFAEHALNQLNDDQFFEVIAPGINSCAIIVNHVAGNMLSRWTDFLTTDGEKPSRDRDQEFVAPQSHTSEARAEIMTRWESGWAVLFDTIGSLEPDDLSKTITIRKVPHPVHAAVARQIDHYSFHIGQFNIIARQLVGTQAWSWFTIPPGGTKAFNDRLMGS